MKNKSQNESGLRQLLEDQLKDVYWAEKAITKAMPEVVEKVSSQELIDALTEHMDETIQQVSRLENVFEIIGVKAEAEKCEAMEGLIEEAEDIIDELEEGPVCDPRNPSSPGPIFLHWPAFTKPSSIPASNRPPGGSGPSISANRSSAFC
jgi:formate dehydrogenase maturation protein FdhE